jgi:carbon storage regulator
MAFRPLAGGARTPRERPVFYKNGFTERNRPMLVLSRKKNEGIVFDGPGRVVVVDIHGDKVRLGFEAERSVTVHREEVAAAIKRQAERKAL